MRCITLVMIYALVNVMNGGETEQTGNGMTKKWYRNIIVTLVLGIFTSTTLLPTSVQAQAIGLALPEPGVMVGVTPAFVPPVLKGVKIYPDNPLMFDFLIDEGDQTLDDYERREEYQRLVNYFMAALTTPEEDMWVNLSPLENNRIVPESFGRTEMGRDLLAQDYILKQLTASLLYPEGEIGQVFWKEVYQKAYAAYGTTEIPVNTFNKVWITPDTATVYEHNTTAMVGENRLKVLLEGDYKALKHSFEQGSFGYDTMSADEADSVNNLSNDIVREIVLPTIEKEVNTGDNFKKLRQIYHSMILASWFKKRLENSIMNKIYVDQKKVNGIEIDDPQAKQKIYDQYIEAYQKGVYDFIKEEYDPFMQQEIPRKYFSGGFDARRSPISPNELDVQPVNDQQMLSQAVGARGKQLVQATITVGVIGALVNGVNNRIDNITDRMNPAAPQVEEIQQADVYNVEQTLPRTVARDRMVYRIQEEDLREDQFRSVASRLADRLDLSESSLTSMLDVDGLNVGDQVVLPTRSLGDFQTTLSNMLDAYLGVDLQGQAIARFERNFPSLSPGRQLDSIGVIRRLMDNDVEYSTSEKQRVLTAVRDYLNEGDGYVSQQGDVSEPIRQLSNSLASVVDPVLSDPITITWDDNVEYSETELSVITTSLYRVMASQKETTDEGAIIIDADDQEAAETTMNDNVRFGLQSAALGIPEAIINRVTERMSVVEGDGEAQFNIVLNRLADQSMHAMGTAFNQVTPMALVLATSISQGRAFDGDREALQQLTGLDVILISRVAFQSLAQQERQLISDAVNPTIRMAIEGEGVSAIQDFNDAFTGFLLTRSRAQDLPDTLINAVLDQMVVEDSGNGQYNVRLKPINVSSSEGESQVVGGIDLNRAFLDLSTEGEMIDVITPEQLRYLETTPVDGFVPNIMSIIPGTMQTLPFFSEMNSDLNVLEAAQLHEQTISLGESVG